MEKPRRFFGAEAVGGETTESEVDTREKIVQVAIDGDALDAAAARALVDGIDPRLTMQLTARQAARHIKLVAAAQHKQPPVAEEQGLADDGRDHIEGQSQGHNDEQSGQKMASQPAAKPSGQ